MHFESSLLVVSIHARIFLRFDLFRCLKVDFVFVVLFRSG